MRSESSQPKHNGSASLSVKSYEHGSGIFSIQMTALESENTLSAALIEQVIRTIDAVRAAGSIKVLILKGTADHFLQAGRQHGNEAVVLRLYQAIASFPYPIIAAMQGNAAGAGFLIGALCDFMFCSQTAQYNFTHAEQGLFPTPEEDRLLRERLGHVRAADFLYRTTVVTGKQLQEKGWSCPVLPQEQVEPYAHTLASQLAKKSQDSLRLLKQHLARRMLELTKALTSVEPHDQALGDGTANSTADITSPSKHIQVETHAEKVLLLTIRAAGKKYDSKKLAADLTHVFSRLRQRMARADAPYRAVVLASEYPHFLPEAANSASTDSVVSVQRALMEAPLPVIAVMSAHATGKDWLIGQFCDDTIYHRDGSYCATSLLQGAELAAMAAVMFSHRFGTEAGQHILLTGATYSGAELQQRVGPLSVAAPEQALHEALRHAECWAQWPADVLVTWKALTTLGIQKELDRLPNASQAELESDTPRSAQALQEAPTPVVLRSKVIDATAHPQGIVVVRMVDRETKNLFSEAFIRGMEEVFAHIDGTPEYKVVVLTGYEQYFASGGTKEALVAIQEGKAKFTDNRTYELALSCKVPVIAAMQGHGIGAGLSMGLFADLALLSEESKYVSPYMSYGFTPGAGATLIVPEKLGLDLARDTLLTAQEYSGSELKSKGAPLAVYPRKEVHAAAMELARHIAQHSRASLIFIKNQLTRRIRERLHETCEQELAMHELTFVGQTETLRQIETSFDRMERKPQRQQLPSDVQSFPEVIAGLKQLLADELHLQEHEIDEDTQFMDLGLDSITGVTWIRRINEQYGLSLEATVVYSNPTLTMLGRYVREETGKLGRNSRQADLEVPSSPSVSLEPELPQTRAALDFATRELVSWRKTRPGSIAATASASKDLSQPIAVIGMAGQFPLARNLEEYWQNLATGRNCISPTSPQRWDVNAYFREGEPMEGKTNCRWMGMLEEYDRFDPLFFNISPAEAKAMDPQQRLFLQACWHSIESAGYNPRSLAGSQCGVFVGCAAGDYGLLSRKMQLTAHGFTGAASSILAARISYFLDLRGPCISIDTACSSSLVAIANACDSLTSGVSDLALAGGVYVSAGPAMHIMSAQAGMLSRDGRCYSFDRRANGFVPGEAVGVVVLKRLADAERDRDMIHAVISGWGVNQDGKTNGITAPNPESQARLQRQVYSRCKIDPTEIQLIEAHGTGTALGDPIEIEGLKKSFKGYTEKQQYCALGSVKSNIGHCLTAAGVSGLIKVVLALKRRQLPPTINFEQLNEHIDLAGSPFYVNTRLQHWALNGASRRQAAINSFGYSGTNAHLVVAEHVPQPSGRQPSAFPRHTKIIVPLSARTAEQLKQRARDLLDFIGSEDDGTDLLDMAYTLQVGREPMEERVGFLVSSTPQLAEKLQAYIGGRHDIADAYQGQVRVSREGMSIISQDDELKETIIDNWIAQKKFPKLLRLWVKGLEFDWNRLYGDVKPQRIVLPTYPFAKERHWIEDVDLETTPTATAVLHPLLHRNSSTLNRQSYTSVFTGQELCFRAGQGMLGAASYLEMARAAVELAVPGPREATVVELRNVVWGESFVAAEKRPITTALCELDTQDCIGFEIFSEEIVHCEGQIVLHSAPVPAIPTAERKLLAELRSPADVSDAERDLLLHPSLMDGAMQACIDLRRGESSSPVALDSLRILKRCTQKMFAWGTNDVSADLLNKLDVDLCDEHGDVCVQMRGLSLHEVPEQAVPEVSPRRLLFKEFWREEALKGPRLTAQDLAAKDTRTTIIFTGAAVGQPLIEGALVLPLPVGEAAIQRAIQQASSESNKPVWVIYAGERGQGQTGIHALFDLFKAIKADVVSDVTLAGHYDPAQLGDCWDYSWIGFERSLKLLLPSVKISLLYTNSSVCSGPQLLDARQSGGVIWYREGRRFVLACELAEGGAEMRMPLVKQNGAYLITGGCGSLGLKFARHLAETYKVRLVLIGRRALSSSMQVQLDGLRQAGAPEVHYAAVDIASTEQMNAWARAVPFQLSGVFHAAGVESARVFHEKSAAEVDEVLRPKTTGTLLLDEVLHGHPLDFVCTFSSSAALLGDFGACDYAIANRFQMAYGEYRALNPRLAGKTVVVNWPLWHKETGETQGMGPDDPEQTAFYLKSSGQEALDTAQGMRIWHDLMQSTRVQTLVMMGHQNRIERFLQRIYQAERPSEGTESPPLSRALPDAGAKPQREDLSVKERLCLDVRQVIAAVLQLEPGRLDDSTNLADYGFDSISLTTLAKRLASRLSLEVTPALFFNYSTVQQLIAHFLEAHQPHLEMLYEHREPPPRVEAVRAPIVESSVSRRRRLHAGATMSTRPRQTRVVQAEHEPIAIIGLSGRFPKASNVDQLWRLLADAKSGMSEVPRSRWNWGDYSTTTNQGGFIEGVDEFDPLFFEVSPREAEEMDPAERALLMESYRAIEDARIAPASLRGLNIGVFVGMEESQYGALTDRQGVTTAGGAMISSRLSYFLDFHGPALATNTACSSGLVALHQAAASLRQGECESALVAGVALSLSPRAWVKMSEAGMISKDGECYSFSKQANGIGIGEAIVVVMLKPLSAALAGGNPVYGIIKGSGINFDGKTNGVTAPNGRMQAKLIEDIYAGHDIDVNDVSHIIAHGTGTPLGDPVELNALNEAFKKLSQRQGSAAPRAAQCAVTSCKTNLGHTMAASGLVSVVALLKGMEHVKIPASLYCEDENEYISWKDSAFYINKSTRDWPRDGDKPLMGAVSAFGRSGTNAHVVIEEYRAPGTTVATAASQSERVLILLSARTVQQLQQKAQDLVELIREAQSGIDLAAMAYTLQVARDAMDERIAVIVSSVEQLAEKLSAYLSGEQHIEDLVRGTASEKSAGISSIGNDADMQDTIGRWLVGRKHSKLAHVWVVGVNVDWEKLHDGSGSTPARIKLPTYPFAKERYWVDDTVTESTVEPRRGTQMESIEETLNRIADGSIATNEGVAFLKRVV